MFPSPLSIRAKKYVPAVNSLAIYAAVVGTISLGWNVWRGLRSERVDVRVTVETEPVLVLPEKDRPAPYQLTVIARNYGATEERVDRIGINYNDPTQDEFGGGGDSKRISETLPPRRNVSQTFNLTGRRFKVGREYVGFVVLASGNTIESELHEFDLTTLELAGVEDSVIEPRRLRTPQGEKIEPD
jgi:hypothetical protein